MIFSVVEIQTWKRCRRRWDLQSENRQALEPIRRAAALDLGSLVHLTLASWTDDPAASPTDQFMAHSNEMLDDVKVAYTERVGAPPSNVELDPLYEAIGLGQVMIKNYQAYYKRPLADEYKSVRTEQRGIVAIPNTEHLECDECHWIPDTDGYYHEMTYGLRCQRTFLPHQTELTMSWQPHFLRGTMDNLVVKDGVLYILERKTYKQRPTVEKLQHDDQQLGYIWMLNQLFPGQVGGVLYDGLWKRETPTRGNGPEVLFFREVFQRNQHEIDEYGYFLAETANEMATVTPEKLYLNRRWEGCYDCGVARLCDAMSLGEDVDYIRDTYFRQRSSGSSSLGISAEDGE